MNATPNVLISEVGPRDGLQSVKATMPTADKLRWLDALVASGLREIEVCSFVPTHLMPQMADAAEVVRHALTHPGLTVMALVPNLKGRTGGAGCRGAQTHPAGVGQPRALAGQCAPNARRHGGRFAPGGRAAGRALSRCGIEAGLSTAFGCTLQGAVSEDEVIRLAVACALRPGPTRWA
jgi:hydroxymethylglutaryl-CoA lyase